MLSCGSCFCRLSVGWSAGVDSLGPEPMVLRIPNARENDTSLLGGGES